MVASAFNLSTLEPEASGSLSSRLVTGRPGLHNGTMDTFRVRTEFQIGGVPHIDIWITVWCLGEVRRNHSRNTEGSCREGTVGISASPFHPASVGCTD